MKSPAIKVCGLTREEDVRLCLELGIGFTGFIFAPGSPRRVSPEAASRLPSGNAARVGVFVNQTLDEVRRVMSFAGLDYAQLHGNEDTDFCRALGPERVIRVLWPERLLPRRGEGDGLSGEALLEALRRECAAYADACALFLLDAGSGGGGSGRVLPWSLLAGFSPPRPWLLAGGIGPLNAAKAFAACVPFGVDCNSAVESAPGIKDAKLLHSLVVNLDCARQTGK